MQNWVNFVAYKLKRRITLHLSAAYKRIYNKQIALNSLIFKTIQGFCGFQEPLHFIYFSIYLHFGGNVIASDTSLA